MAILTSNTVLAGYEPIKGYKLEEVIGRGGFGEVWRADAPGGLKKAVKFVFGAQDQHRAERELKSLERIKGVQHPFLLSLERFEIVQDQLVIVTELADCSLEDVYDRHRKNGSCGIPREALLSYMHDAADALDYLHSQYQLQHLDIKPGNMLMFGEHVKVADFGLLKDLRETECSVVGGLTPVYAPPEVFDGRPSMNSDQYSLAVMYQELLTGTRPFSGRTIAQLATQHVHSAPNLEPVPPSDRPMMARALEKNPERRFGSCKEFVEGLRLPRSRVSVPAPQVDETPASIHKVDDLPQLIDFAPIEETATTCHALVIGLGGTGAECLTDLHERGKKLHTACPVDLHTVLIDTDMMTIHQSRRDARENPNQNVAFIHTPLRTAHEYRNKGTDHLKSISRRWIYNVPRNGTTEGMRPLGRLALVDNGPLVSDQLRQAVQRLASAAGDSTPNVYLVGSLAGGTGSGMFIDVVHLLKHLLDEAGLHETRILSLLATTSLAGDPNRLLGLHDTHAAVTEMGHFMQPGNGYPGDKGAQWPSVPAARTPLRDVYLIASPSGEYPCRVPSETITNYIWTDATGAGGLLAAARQGDTDADNSDMVEPAFRSVGIIPLGAAHSINEQRLTPGLVRGLLLRWLGNPAKARQAADPLAKRLMSRCRINAEAFIDTGREIFGKPGTEQRKRLVEQVSSHHAQNPADEAAMIDSLASLLANSVKHDDDDHTQDDLVLAGLYRELSSRLHDGRTDVATSIDALGLLVRQAEQLEQELRQGTAKYSGVEAKTDTDEHRSETDKVVERAIEFVAADCAEKVCRRLERLEKQFGRYATTLAQAIVQFNDGTVAEENPWDTSPGNLRKHFDWAIHTLHGKVDARWLLRAIGDPASIDIQELTASVSEEAISVIALVLQRVDAGFDTHTVAEGLTGTDSKLSNISSLTHEICATQTQVFQPNAKRQSPTSIDHAIVAVRPALLACGGCQRLLLIVGSTDEQQRLEARIRDMHDGSLTVSVVPGASPTLILEAQKIKIDDVLARLNTLTGGNSGVSLRLQSRTDVQFKAEEHNYGNL